MKDSEEDEEGALIFDPLDVASMAAKAAFVCACLDTMRAEGDQRCNVAVPWRECLFKGTRILQCAEPQVVAYLQAWERADARNEAYVRGGLVVAAPPSSDGKEVWEQRAEAAGQRARRRTLGLTSEWSAEESSEESSSDGEQ